MNTAARVISLLALGGTILPPMLLIAGRVDLAAMKWWMVLAAVAWFAATPLWMDRNATAGKRDRRAR